MVKIRGTSRCASRAILLNKHKKVSAGLVELISAKTNAALAALCRSQNPRNIEMRLERYLA